MWGKNTRVNDELIPQKREWPLVRAESKKLRYTLNNVTYWKDIKTTFGKSPVVTHKHKRTDTHSLSVMFTVK